MEAANGERGLQHVGDVDAGADDAAHQPALQHAARPVLVAVHRDRRALREGGGVRRAEPRDEFRGEVDVHDPGDAETPEEGAPALRAPDEARAHDRAGLDLLVGPDLYLRTHPRMLADDRVVADDASFLEHHARLEGALPPDDRAVQLRALPDVAVAPHDRAVDDRPDVDRDVVAKDGRSDDLDVGADLHALAAEDRAGDPRRLVDVDLACSPHAGHELLPQSVDADAAAQEIRVRACVLLDRPDIGPVAVGDVAEEGLAVGEEPREEILAEIEDLADIEPFEHPRLDDVDARVDGVAEDLAPRRL